ncbi:MAG: hypothetical protein IJ630_00665 [Treponema sp.]|nr:hypothetical protein [Treponema sp.]
MQKNYLRQSQKSEPKNRNEEEISGYRDVLNTIHESYDYISPAPGIIQQLHRDLYTYNKSSGYGGKYKSSDNIIAGPATSYVWGQK